MGLDGRPTSFVLAIRHTRRRGDSPATATSTPYYSVTTH